MAVSPSQAINSGELTDLISSSSSATVYPSDDTLLSVLQARFRTDLPYARIGTSNLVVVNPYKTLNNVSDASAKEYEERCYKDTSIPLPGDPPPPQPHIYDLAARVYLLMRRRNESQSVVFRGITASGKTHSSQLLVNQVLRLSSHSKKEAKLAAQIKALSPLLDSFGSAKTLISPNASRYGRYLELHFGDRGRISSAKVLTYGLDKSRLNRLSFEERTYHVFYQFLAGATPDERDTYNLEDPSDDDNAAMDELRAAMKTLGFKQKHISSIFSLLVAILTLSNIQFTEPDSSDVSAYIANPLVLEEVARLLGVPLDDLSETLTNKTNYVRKELYTVLLNAQQAASQRDSLMRDLYAILFAFVVETANHRIAPSPQSLPPPAQIVLLDQPGFQTKGAPGSASVYIGGPAPLLSPHGQAGFDEFCINFANEMVQSFILRNAFEDFVGYNGEMTRDGVSLPAIATMDNSACIELLRGAQLSERASKKPGGLLGVTNKASSSFKSGKSGEKRDEELLQDLVAKFGVHASFIANPPEQAATSMEFGINHFAGPCSYDVHGFVEKDTDILDTAFVSLLRNSTDPFISKLMSGPSLATERHAKDESMIAQAQVSSRPLRQPTPILSRDGAAPAEAEEHSHLDPAKAYPVTTQLNHNLSEIMTSMDRTRLWTVSCIRPNDSGSSNSFDKRRVKAQIRALLLPDLVSRKKVDFVADFEHRAFCDRYVPTMGGSEAERIRQCAHANGWQDGVDYVVGHRSIWLTYMAWKMVEDVLRGAEKDAKKSLGVRDDEDESVVPDDMTEATHHDAPSMPAASYYGAGASEDNLLLTRTGTHGTTYRDANTKGGYAQVGLSTPNVENTPAYSDQEGEKDPGYAGSPALEKEPAGAVEEIATTRIRRWWIAIVWLVTWWIIGRMKRPDIRLAWREKVTIFFLIIFFNGVFGRLLCPDYDKAWNTNQLGQHTGTNDFYVAIQGTVYDVSNDIPSQPSNGADTLDYLAGQDLTYYFPPPLTLACPNLVTNEALSLTAPTNWTETSFTSSKLHQDNWYTTIFQPKINQYKIGAYSAASSSSSDNSASDQRYWAIWDNSVYDLSAYFQTLTNNDNSNTFTFLDSDLSGLWQSTPGQDISKDIASVLATMNSSYAEDNVRCIKNMFYWGEMDFRSTPRCQVQNIMLIVFSAIIMSSMAIKFLAALQLTPKSNPEMLDKFVICQVPCYTEGEESLRRTLDSLAALNYDDKRKLMFIICDGNIIGNGNDRTTPRIALDLLGVDPQLDPEPLLFKSIGEGSKALNYGKVYSGLYEFEGHVVPYIVVVKVGKPTERTKPGNRGKRDSQILVMQYLNRVHFDAPMTPLELEIYHQMRNVIGIDPAFYEYIFTIDADTSVTPDSLNRLVAATADDSSIIGICGETRLDNPEKSWWTMIQVYEYYISHHLSKAFESLFGSVSCLPGCFSLYRIRTADKGRPVIISNRIIEEYAEPNVDTLHKKNLFSLGEDRFLTTLMLKHFPTFRTKFLGSATAHTIAPESWRVLFSQRRRWINSTVHNLCELVLLPDMFGFCCFSMRFFVFVDLLGTLILPATVVYLLYLIIVVSTRQAAFPLISIIMIAAVYGLQMIIFLLKREFMLIGWMVVYIISYPVYSFFLPIYSYWCMDDFSWGNTRLVIGEGSNKKVIMNDEEKFDESMIPLKKFSEYEAEAWETGTRHSDETGYSSKPHSRVRGSVSGSQSPRSHHPGSQLRGRPSQTNLSQYGGQPVMSQYSLPQLPFMPMAGGPGSVAGSDYGGHSGHMSMGMPMGYQNTGSMYGMMPTAPRNTQSGHGLAAPMMPAAQRPMSTFSMATSVNPFAGPSMNPDPTDEDLVTALRQYLSTQDLMTVTKKTAREAIQAKFPKADLSGRKQFLNDSIDQILSQA
ncbi:chitin synthase [Fomitopsis serialis]|uniref:chitin synthase n=1 Tax=Fomitopsis serialis TaxID=139415 RepID=UPI002007C582|nr:chitin synthase [Neoantrodia serialis]KAH9919697.1 chitin synthase [Neoantrodia serialis]